MNAQRQELHPQKRKGGAVTDPRQEPTGKKLERGHAHGSTECRSWDCNIIKLPNELLLVILSKALADAPDLPHALATAAVCKQFRAAFYHPSVLCSLPSAAVSVPFTQWAPGACRILALSARAGNPHACYHLGMIMLYCQEDLAAGLALLSRAAAAQHPEAMYSLAIVEFNGSASSSHTRNFNAGRLLSCQASLWGHSDALLEFGHCLINGLGTPADIVRGKRLVVLAQAWQEAEAAAASVGSQARDPPSDSRLVEEGLRDLLEAAPSMGSCQGQSSAGQKPAHYCTQDGKKSPEMDVCCPVVCSATQPLLCMRGSSVPWGLGEPGRSEPIEHVLQEEQARNRERQQPWPRPNVGRWKPLHARRHQQQQQQQHTLQLNEGGGCHRNLAPCSRTHKFLVDWWAARMEAEQAQPHGSIHRMPFAQELELRALCSNDLCGRRELRPKEFRCCSSCCEARYCSHACQAKDWRRGHKVACTMLSALLREQAMQQQLSTSILREESSNSGINY